MVAYLAAPRGYAPDASEAPLGDGGVTAWWSWIFLATGITGLLLAGSKRRSGWALGFAAQFLWMVYAVTTEQWGFLIAAPIYATVYARNWWAWRPASRTDGQGS